MAQRRIRTRRPVYERTRAIGFQAHVSVYTRRGRYALLCLGRLNFPHTQRVSPCAELTRFRFRYVFLVNVPNRRTVSVTRRESARYPR